MSAALTAVLGTIDAEIARLQQAREVVAGLTGPLVGGSVRATNGARVPTLAEFSAAFEETQTAQPIGSFIKPAPAKPKHPIRAPEMPRTLPPKVALTPEQIAIIRKGAQAEKPNISAIAREAGVSDYVVRTRIATWTAEGSL